MPKPRAAIALFAGVSSPPDHLRAPDTGSAGAPNPKFAQCAVNPTANFGIGPRVPVLPPIVRCAKAARARPWNESEVSDKGDFEGLRRLLRLPGRGGFPVGA
jgi:hypothetical protein